MYRPPQQQSFYAGPEQQQQQGGVQAFAEGLGPEGMAGLQGLFGGGAGGGGSALAAGSVVDAGAVGGGAGAAAGTGGTSAAGGAAGGGSSWIATAGPWAALAAAIIANEHEAKEGGYRDEDTGDYAKDVLGGKVLEQDVSQRWTTKLFGEDLKNDHFGLGGDMVAGADLATFDFSNAWDAFKNKGVLSKIFG